jgi:NTP pyrophosphatase (non-canonical NTP hydrolase)
MTDTPLFFSDADFDSGFEAFQSYWEDQVYATSVDRLIEEMSELCKILLKERRGQMERGGKLVSELIKDEMADVMLCMEYIGRHRGIDTDDIVDRIAFKSQRIVRKLGGKKNADTTNK